MNKKIRCSYLGLSAATALALLMPANPTKADEYSIQELSVSASGVEPVAAMSQEVQNPAPEATVVDPNGVLESSSEVGVLEVEQKVTEEPLEVAMATKENPSSDTGVPGNLYTHLTSEKVEIKSGLGYDFYEDLPMPEAKENGRGEPLLPLISDYGNSYIEDPFLKEDVLRFRRWDWNELYSSLDKKVQENPEHLDTYRLQAEIYLVNKKYREAFSQIDKVLRRDPSDIHALSLSVLAAKVTGEKEQVKNRLAVLKHVSRDAYNSVLKVLRDADAHNATKINYGSDQLTEMVPDAIAVFGQSPNSDGTPSPALLSRLEKTKEMAERYPDIPIVLSGGPVRYEYAEADVMAKWLKSQGIDEKRFILDAIARDTPGNAIGMVKAFEAVGARKILAIGTILHLPRAVTVLKVYADTVGYDLVIDSAGGGKEPSASKKEIERLYTYVNALRAGYLYTKEDFEKFSKSEYKVVFKNQLNQLLEERSFKFGDFIHYPDLQVDGYRMVNWKSEDGRIYTSLSRLSDNLVLYPILEKITSLTPNVNVSSKFDIEQRQDRVEVKMPRGIEKRSGVELIIDIRKAPELSANLKSEETDIPKLPKTGEAKGDYFSLFGLGLIGFLGFVFKRRKI
ncbi:YdcF family protein [Streptococcus danieliae]|uniref:YdcF family protein n=1 Tax=Streptococcus danieliae TaxID=747656 RepID=A0A7Z0LDD5_9STRE|nr:ElyC/SanA/YdcF family protein [Streptococcus danieliae]MBF0717477.1 YdcF family protein [Streptococcus danieliae]NYS49407.1 YdcF family protein [Streptococcus danieliae]